MRKLFVAISAVAGIFFIQTTSADEIRVKTARGIILEAVVDFPDGKGPFPTLVLAPGQAYHLGLPVIAQTAHKLVEQGFAVYRFNWAYYTRDQRAGQPSDDLAAELQDLLAVVDFARADSRVDRSRLAVGGKSLGSVVAWQALAKDKAIRAGLFLTPVCSQGVLKDVSAEIAAAQNYPGISIEKRPIALVSGDQDPLCSAALLYRFASSAAGLARVAVVGGDHGFGNRSLNGPSADAARDRNVSAVAQLSANFLKDTLSP